MTTLKSEEQEYLDAIEAAKLALYSAIGGPYLDGQNAFVAYNQAIINYTQWVVREVRGIK